MTLDIIFIFYYNITNICDFYKICKNSKLQMHAYKKKKLLSLCIYIL